MSLYTLFTITLKGLGHELASNFSTFIISFLLSIMANMDEWNALSKFESQVLSYKQNTELENLCFVNKAWALLWFTCVLLV